MVKFVILSYLEFFIKNIYILIIKVDSLKEDYQVHF